MVIAGACRTRVDHKQLERHERRTASERSTWWLLPMPAAWKPPSASVAESSPTLSAMPWPSAAGAGEGAVGQAKGHVILSCPLGRSPSDPMGLRARWAGCTHPNGESTATISRSKQKSWHSSKSWRPVCCAVHHSRACTGCAGWHLGRRRGRRGRRRGPGCPRPASACASACGPRSRCAPSAAQPGWAVCMHSFMTVSGPLSLACSLVLCIAMQECLIVSTCPSPLPGTRAQSGRVAATAVLNRQIPEKMKIMKMWAHTLSPR